MKTIYLVRHGETYLNKFLRIQGWSEMPLTPEGIKVVEKTGQALKNTKFDLAVSSDLKRSTDSRDIILRENKYGKDTKIAVTPLFREEFFGFWDCLPEKLVSVKVSGDQKINTFAKLKESGINMRALRQKLKELDPYHLCENEDELKMRVAKAFKWLDQYDNSQRILLIGHGFLTQFITQVYAPGKFDTTHIPGNSTLTLLHLNHGKVTVDKYGKPLI